MAVGRHQDGPEQPFGAVGVSPGSRCVGLAGVDPLEVLDEQFVLPVGLLLDGLEDPVVGRRARLRLVGEDACVSEERKQAVVGVRRGASDPW